MASLYEINADIEGCVDMETGEIIDEEKLDSLEMERDEKIENIGLWIKNLLSEAEAIKAEKLSLAHRETVRRNKADYLKRYLQGALDGEKFETAKLRISYRKSEGVEILDEESIPEEYKTYEPHVNKTAIKDAIKDGKDVKGAELVERQNIQIK